MQAPNHSAVLPLELPRARAHRGVLLVIAALHGLALWGLAQSMAQPAVVPALAPLVVRLVASEPAPAPTATVPLRRPETPAPRPVWVPVPEVPVPVAPATPSAHTAPTEPAASPAVAMATFAAASAPPAPRPAPPERQIAITQVEYLSPPVLNYPQAARRQREQGQVQVRVRVDEHGRPERFVVLRSSGFERLDDAALATVRATRFKPYTEDGVARPFWVVMPLVFELDT